MYSKRLPKKIEESDLIKKFGRTKKYFENIIPKIGKSMELSFKKSKNSKLKLPKEDINNKKYVALLIYYTFKKCILNKKYIEKYLSNTLNIIGDRQEFRHLGKNDGFDILQCGDMFKTYKLKRGEYLFNGFENVNKFYSKNRRNERSLNWDGIKQKYNHRCACCGCKNGSKHRYTNQVVILEKGHKNPINGMVDDNIIPLCKYCNQIFSDKFILNDQGLPIQPNSKIYNKRIRVIK